MEDNDFIIYDWITPLRELSKDVEEMKDKPDGKH